MNRGRAAAVAGLAGFAVMSLELTAVRLLAPHFGDSAYVWTNVIGVILVALAAGAVWGGRMADGQAGPRRLALLFLTAGVLVALVPVVARTLGSWLLPPDLPLDAAMPGLVRGSLAATLIMFAPAVLLLGCVTPILITTLAAADGKVGRASGLVAATSTLGSLVGTFATTHLLVPELGSRLTVWLCAVLLFLCSLLSRPGRSAGLAVLLPLALALVPWGPMRPPLPGGELLAEVESPYQYLQVVRGQANPDDPTSPVITSLKINEGLDSFHSLAVDGSAYTGEFYYDYHAAVPFLVGDGARPDPLRVLSLGDAAGTFNRLFAHAHPGCTVDAVELDAAVVQLGDEYFGGRTASGRVFAGLDARVFVERSQQQYDVILVDAYERQIYIPAHVASVEFFTAVKARLAEAGVVSVNVGGLDFDDPVVRGLGSTMAEVFGNSHGFHIPYSRNFMLVARKAAQLDPTVLGRVRVADPQLQEILNRTAAAHGWRSFSAADGGHVLRDDRPVLDELLDRSGYGAGSVSITQIAGDRDPVEVGTEVRDLLGAANPRGAIATLSEAQRATAFLRILAGDARWSMGNLRGAMAEYRAAQDIPGDPVQGDLETYLNTQLAALGEALASRDKAISIATRNGWLAALLAAALATAAFLALRRT